MPREYVRISSNINHIDEFADEISHASSSPHARLKVLRAIKAPEHRTKVIISGAKMVRPRKRVLLKRTTLHRDILKAIDGAKPTPFVEVSRSLAEKNNETMDKLKSIFGEGVLIDLKKSSHIRRT